MKTFLAILTDDLYDELKDKAHTHQVSMSEVVRQYILQCDNMQLTKYPTKVRRITTAEWRQKVLKRDNYTCRHCLKKFSRTTGLLFAHHLKPKNKGGKNTLDNGLTLCRDCHTIVHHNIKKHNT